MNDNYSVYPSLQEMKLESKDELIFPFFKTENYSSLKHLSLGYCAINKYDRITKICYCPVDDVNTIFIPESSDNLFISLYLDGITVIKSSEVDTSLIWIINLNTKSAKIYKEYYQR